MKRIIKHGVSAPLKDKIDDVKFKCDWCGCVFTTDSFICRGIGSFGFTDIYSSCPECPRGGMIKKTVRTSFIMKQIRSD